MASSLAPFALLAFTLPAAAHDFWIEPATYQPAAGDVVPVTLRVGDHFEGEALPRDQEFLQRFQINPASGPPMALPGVQARNPAGVAACREAGLHTLSFESKPRYVELQAQAFHQYLLEEGLEEALRQRLRSGEAKLPGRERFVRCAKSLLRVDGSCEAERTHVVGLTLELVPRSDPFEGRELELELLYRGGSLPGALVVAVPKDGAAEGQRVTGRTDERGRVRLTLPERGTWLIKTVHMQRLSSAPGSGARADWESHWASLTLQRGTPSKNGGSSAAKGEVGQGSGYLGNPTDAPLGTSKHHRPRRSSARS